MKKHSNLFLVSLFTSTVVINKQDKQLHKEVADELVRRGYDLMQFFGKK